ncbi:putative fatty acyl-CoA reductase CG5065 [Phlebotomus argentipes]|uniref:putative fatty acyl-CoA reductase CG5065 n=1 Tax=Phlebotomus argentipes TaxID=94469 RepID=UPI002892C8A9|nr:putative fatty acyl-CoA reductase CG5065 [Phlebotomus argentipes]
MISTSKEYKSISQFYTNRSVLVTGASGFVGKVLVEKLLRSCPGIKNIYLLIRPKRGQEVKARLNDLLGAPLFDTLRRERPSDLNKVIPILGDITSEQLGISENDQALLCRTVSVVFHSAATVKFTEKLKLSVAINMLGTKRLVELCHRMMSLDALVHVSTAYCNCDRAEVSEVIYAPPYNPNDIISLVDWLPEEMLDALTPSLIGRRPNTYTFTKALAEHMLLNEAGNLPVAIVRPSIVLASFDEPLPGWLESFNGPTGAIITEGIGLAKVLLVDGSKIADIVPVDKVVNLMIVSAWKLAECQNRSPAIYNCTSGRQNPLTWSLFTEYCTNYLRKYPLENVFWYPFTILVHTEPLFTILSFLLQTLPIYFMDILFRIFTARRFKFVYTYLIKVCLCFNASSFRIFTILKKYNKLLRSTSFFATRQWTFADDNVRSLLKNLSPEDEKIFNFDMANISWEKYLERYVFGVRKYLMKQDPQTIVKTKKKLQKLYFINFATAVLIIVGFFYILITLSIN